MSSESSTDAPMPAKGALPPGWTEGAPLEHYKGACHCRKFEFEFDHPNIEQASFCNCSICTQTAITFVYVPDDGVKFTKGSKDELSKYLFGKKTIEHIFCPTCGCQILGRGFGFYFANVRSLEGIDINKLKLDLYDGKSIPL